MLLFLLAHAILQSAVKQSGYGILVLYSNILVVVVFLWLFLFIHSSINGGGGVMMLCCVRCPTSPQFKVKGREVVTFE